uniref:Uncharacterized protein n=1 Tax=Ditylum brightwellii TaxID=49249 RepID=A0A7S4QXW7_9STRA
MTNAQCVSIILKEEAQGHQKENSARRDKQTDESFDKVESSKGVTSDFIKMTELRNNGKARETTEYHFIHFIPCLEEMLNDVDTDENSDSESDEEEES